MRDTLRALLPAVTLLGLGSPVWADAAADRAALLDGVRALPKVGVPGPLAVFGAEAFAVLTGLEGEAPRAVVAAARHGRGRAVAFGHSGYLAQGAFDAPGGGRLLLNAARWAGGVAAPRLLLLAPRPRLERFFAERGCVVRVVANELGESLEAGDVVVWNGELGANSLRLDRHVRQGGGLIAAVCPWGTQQLRGPRGFRLHEDLQENAVLGPMGLVFAHGYLRETGSAGFLVSASRPEEVHAGRALRALAAGEGGLGARVLEHAVRAVPPRNASLLGRVREQVGPLRAGPTPATPLADPRARLAAVLAFHASRGLAPGDVRMAPGAATFPGGVHPEAPRVRRRLRLDGRRPGWHSTGLYVPPGQVVRLTRAGPGPRWTVRVGCHTDRLWAKESWERWPEVAGRWVLEGEELVLASPFGGLLYLEPVRGGEALDVDVEGVVEAPSFDLSDPASRAAWPTRRAAPGPWAELAGRHLILSVPSAAVRDLDDPTALMQWWDRVLECYAELGQRPLGPRPQRFVADVQISAGYMHSGYPIMTHLDVATARSGRPAPVLDLQRLRREGSWGHFHELGHNHQEDEWTFAGTGEVTCNLFTLYVMNEVVGIEPWEHPWLANGRRRAPEHLRAGAPFERWKRDPGLALVLYAEVQRAFGWAPFKAVFREYAGLSTDERPRSDAEKRDQWLLRLSRAVRRDLGPFFQRWGIPTTEGARAQLSDLEPWLPE